MVLEASGNLKEFWESLKQLYRAQSSRSSVDKQSHFCFT